MRFPPSLLDEIRARLPVSQVVSRRVNLKRQGREYIGLSPFKVEKSPSFTVNDHKGFYHCFSSGEHGDIFTFLMKTEGLSFPEAVERLAEEAGVPMPKEAPEARQAGEERDRLGAVMEASCRWFEEALAGPQGREARAYLERRGVAPALRQRFRMGFAPDSRAALKDHLGKLGFAATEIARAGMVVTGPEIAVPYDRFRGRVMIPITDLKDRVIAFGARALASDVKPKYLNSPETPLFHKGSVLFNAAKARGPAHDAGSVVVVEGYMDAIALYGAGITHVVAPLGTALTEQQMRLLWRFASEPVLCFDGDAAGIKAAYRAVEAALPLLQPGFSLRFAFLPQGLDPDDLIRQQGAEAARRVLGAARPLIDVLWERELGSGDWSTPERKARLEQRLAQLAGAIADGSVRAQYQRSLRDKLWEHWKKVRTPYATGSRSGPAQAYGGKGRTDPRLAALRPSASSSLRSSTMVNADAGDATMREVLLLRCLTNHPWLIDDWAEEVAALHFTVPLLARLRDAILSVHARVSPLDSGVLATHLKALGPQDALALVARATTHRSDRFAEPGAPRPDVERGWRDALALQRQFELGEALSAAQQAYFREQTEVAYARLDDLRRQLQELHDGESDRRRAAGQNGG